MGGALVGVLAPPPPVAKGLLRKPRFGGALRQQLGLRLGEGGKLRRQYVGNVLVGPLPGVLSRTDTPPPGAEHA